MRATTCLAALVLGALLGCGGASSSATSNPTQASATGPELSSWMRNTTGLTGYGGLPADVQSVQYSAGSVYVNASGIPDYTIGPWPGDPNTPTDQHFLIRIPRAPQAASGSFTATPLGSIGLLINGVVIYNPKDAMSYNNQNIWHQNAVVVEASSFDKYLGHPDQGGNYHHHQNPIGLYMDTPGTHAPLLGFAYDGYPIYGARGYANADGTGGVVRLNSSYQLRAITQRHTLSDGTVLPSNQWGPDVSSQYPLGYYIEDFAFVQGSGDLDVHNGRSAVTPEYPKGTYAYYATIDANGASAYPYILGPTYYGVPAADTLQSHGHVTIGESVTTY